MQDLLVEKFSKMIKKEISLEKVKKTLNLTEEEVIGLIELSKAYGKNIELEFLNGEYIIKKSVFQKTKKLEKPNIEELNHTKIGVVSDTHFGSVKQQLHLVNKSYLRFRQEEISTVLHVGDLVDGDYRQIRKEQERQLFLKGFDEQAGYVCEMYPEITDIKTYFILGSHDETHFKNGMATIGYWIPKVRKDLVYLGQDSASLTINKIKITLDHPGDGSAKGLSYSPQNRIELLETGEKPKILLIGHYHKDYYFSYRNVKCIEVPCLCDKSQFQQKKGLINNVGSYILDIYSDNKGNIVYFTPTPIRYNREDMLDESGKDIHKVKKIKL